MKKYVKLNSLRFNFSLMFLGNVIYAVCQWGLLSVIAKMGSAYMVGQYTLGLAITAPIYTIANLQLRGIQATDVKDTYGFGNYFALRLTTTGFAMLLCILVIISGDYEKNNAMVIFFISFAKTIESISDIIFGLFQKNEAMEKIFISLTCKGVLSLVTLGVALWITSNMVFGAAALALCWLAILFLFDIRRAKLYVSNARADFDFQALKSLLKISFPIATVAFLLSLNTNIPRYIIQYHKGTLVLGYFTAIAYVSVAGSLAITALGQAASPRLAKLYAVGNKMGFNILVIKLISIVLLGGTIGIICAYYWGLQILSFLYSVEYSAYKDVFVLIMISLAISYVSMILGYALTAAWVFKEQVKSTMASVLVNLIACWALIPLWGIEGAAYALIIANSIQAIFMLCIYFIFQKRWNNREVNSQ